MERSRVAQQVEDMGREKPEQRGKQDVNENALYPTGSTMVNLCCSDSAVGGYKLGTINTSPGSSASGKSFLGETALAEGVYDPRFDGYDFYRDDAEASYDFDTTYLFGEKVAERIMEPPLGLSNTIQSFKSNMLTVMKKRPCIYLLDSLDTLSSDEELEKEMARAVAAAKSEEAAKKIAGSYGMEKAKIMGQVLRMINQKVRETKSLLIIVQQVRQKTDALPFSNPYTTSGGEAPFFYSHVQLWLSKVGTLKRSGLKVGTQVKVQVTKNKINGKLRDAEFNIWYDYGVDDVRSMVDFLLEQEVWSKESKSVITNSDLGEVISGTCLADGTGTLMDDIVRKGLTKKLKNLVEEIWRNREESVRLNRIPRF